MNCWGESRAGEEKNGLTTNTKLGRKEALSWTHELFGKLSMKKNTTKDPSFIDRQVVLRIL